MIFGVTLKTLTFQLKTVLATFWATLVKLGLPLISISGHTESDHILFYELCSSLTSLVLRLIYTTMKTRRFCVSLGQLATKIILSFHKSS